MSCFCSKFHPQLLTIVRKIYYSVKGISQKARIICLLSNCASYISVHCCGNEVLTLYTAGVYTANSVYVDPVSGQVENWSSNHPWHRLLT